MPDHQPGGVTEPVRAHEMPLPGQRQRNMNGGEPSDGGIEPERGAPAAMVGNDARQEPPEKAAEPARGDVGAGRAGDLVHGPLVADVGERHGEDRRQQQTLHEPPENQLADRRAERDERGRHHHQRHGAGDDPLTPQDVRDQPDEGCSQGDTQGRGADGEAHRRGAGIEVAGEERQQRLRCIEVDEGAEPRESDREAAGIKQHRGLRGWGCAVSERKTLGAARPRRHGRLAGTVLRPCPVDSTAVGAP